MKYSFVIAVLLGSSQAVSLSRKKHHHQHDVEEPVKKEPRVVIPKCEPFDSSANVVARPNLGMDCWSEP